MMSLGEAGQELTQAQEKLSRNQGLDEAENDFWAKLEEAEKAARTDLRGGRRGDAKPGPPSQANGDFDQKMQALVDASRKVTELRQAVSSSGEVKAAEDAFIAKANETEKAASEKMKALKRGS